MEVIAALQQDNEKKELDIKFQALETHKLMEKNNEKIEQISDSYERKLLGSEIPQLIFSIFLRNKLGTWRKSSGFQGDAK